MPTERNEHQKRTERFSLSSVLGHEVLTAAGVVEQAAATVTDARGFMVIVAWTQADDLLIRYVGETDFQTIPSLMAKALGVGAIYDFAIDAIKSSGANETAFSIALLK